MIECVVSAHEHCAEPAEGLEVIAFGGSEGHFHGMAIRTSVSYVLTSADIPQLNVAASLRRSSLSPDRGEA